MCVCTPVCQGRYVWKLLAVDIRPAGATLHTSGASGAHTASGGNPDGERIYVEGDLATYKRGGVLSELRDPFLRVSLTPFVSFVS